jgi:hypothetical protein
MDLRAQPWWTAADEAELDLLIEEFTRVAFVHREKCSTCRAGGPWCPPMVDALEAVFEWREGRVLRSKASWLRARQELAERAA